MRSKDGVPISNGESASFQTYEEMALQWEQGIPWHKRYLCGPRLVSELTGSAKKHILGKRPDWLSFNGGVDRLLQHLRQALGRPQIAEMSDHLNRYFKATKRKKMESMNDYITRKIEAYTRARQALCRVERDHGGRRGDRATSYGNWQYGGQWDGWQDRAWESEGEGAEFEDAEERHDEPDGGRLGSEGPGEDGSQQRDGSESRQWSWWGSRGSYWSTSNQSTHEDESWTTQAKELLPDFLQGWYLLQDATLEAHERNLVQTAIRGNYGLQRVAQELRNQWPEEDLKKRDQGTRQQGLWQDEIGDDYGDEEEEGQAWHYDDLVRDGMNEEGLALIGDAEEEAEQALTLIAQGKRTLKEARSKQHQVKMSRQYYKSSYTTKGKSWGKGGKGKTGGKGVSCFRCGGAHRTSACPDRQAPSGTAPQAHQSDEAAPFICYSDTKDEAMAYYGDGQLRSTAEAVASDMGVIDGGATRTLASVYALEKLANINEAKYGNNGIIGIDTSEKPTFGFGNSSKDTCVSTAQVNVWADERPGVLKVHALERGTGPLLLSVATLRSLGAIIDFEADVAVFRRLNDKKLVTLERSATGHQLISLTEDLLAKAQECKQAIPSLTAFC